MEPFWNGPRWMDERVISPAEPAFEEDPESESAAQLALPLPHAAAGGEAGGVLGGLRGALRPRLPGHQPVPAPGPDRQPGLVVPLHQGGQPDPPSGQLERPHHRCRADWDSSPRDASRSTVPRRTLPPTAERQVAERARLRKVDPPSPQTSSRATRMRSPPNRRPQTPGVRQPGTVATHLTGRSPDVPHQIPDPGGPSPHWPATAYRRPTATPILTRTMVGQGELASSGRKRHPVRIHLESADSGDDGHSASPHLVPLAGDPRRRARGQRSRPPPPGHDQSARPQRRPDAGRTWLAPRPPLHRRQRRLHHPGARAPGRPSTGCTATSRGGTRTKESGPPWPARCRAGPSSL